MYFPCGGAGSFKSREAAERCCLATSISILEGSSPIGLQPDARQETSRRRRPALQGPGPAAAVSACAPDLDRDRLTFRVELRAGTGLTSCEPSNSSPSGLTDVQHVCLGGENLLPLSLYNHRLRPDQAPTDGQGFLSGAIRGPCYRNEGDPNPTSSSTAVKASQHAVARRNRSWRPQYPSPARVAASAELNTVSPARPASSTAGSASKSRHVPQARRAFISPAPPRCCQTPARTARDRARG